MRGADLFFLSCMFVPSLVTMPEGPMRTMLLAKSWENWTLLPSFLTIPEGPAYWDATYVGTGTGTTGPGANPALKAAWPAVS